MTPSQLAQAKDKNIAASLIAMRRAAQTARELAMRTGTAIVVQRNHQPVRITAEQLRLIQEK